jgi:hypothetical protein
MSEETKDPNFFYVTVDRQKYNDRVKRYYQENRETILAKLKDKRDAVKKAKEEGTYIEPEIKKRNKLEGDTITIKVNKEKFKITSKKFYEKNKERLNEKRRQNYKEGGKEKTVKELYYWANREDIIEKTKARYHANKIERALSHDNNKKL